MGAVVRGGGPLGCGERRRLGPAHRIYLSGAGDDVRGVCPNRSGRQDRGRQRGKSDTLDAERIAHPEPNPQEHDCGRVTILHITDADALHGEPFEMRLAYDRAQVADGDTITLADATETLLQLLAESKGEPTGL